MVSLSVIIGVILVPTLVVLGLLWIAQIIWTGAIKEGSERFAERAAGIATGSIIVAASVVDQLVGVGGELFSVLFQVPGVIIAGIGLGQSSGAIDLSPGLFAIAAIGTFVLSAAMNR